MEGIWVLLLLLLEVLMQMLLLLVVVVGHGAAESERNIKIIDTFSACNHGIFLKKH